MKTLIVYRDKSGREPFSDWLARLRDPVAKARIEARLFQLQKGNPGDVRPIGGGVSEMRIHIGQGYRVYYATDGDVIVLLLCGGTKSTQRADIRLAHECWSEWKGDSS